MVGGLVSCAADYSSLLTLLERGGRVRVITSKDKDGQTVLYFIETPVDESPRYFWEEKKRIHRTGLGVTLIHQL